MPPRKKVKLDVSTSNRKRKNKIQTTPKKEIAQESSNIGGDELFFSLLPNEVLQCIYRYLSPADLLSMAALGEPRFKESILVTKDYNFSSCRTANLDVKSFFHSYTNDVRKLNFNNEIYITPSELTRFICRCKNLTHLSIVNSGINHLHILKILSSCPKLQELAWDVNRKLHFIEPHTEFMQPGLKKVYLFRELKKMKSYRHIMKTFPHAETIFVNCCSNSLLALPFVGVWSRAYCLSFPDHRNCSYIFNSFQSSRDEFDFQRALYIVSLRCEENIYSDEELENMRHPAIYNCPPFLQIQCSEEDIKLLRSYENKQVIISSVNLIVHPHIVSLWWSIIKTLIDIAGHTLQHFSIDSTGNEDEESADGEIPAPISAQESLAVCNMFDQELMSFKNITVLNIATVHFTGCSPFISPWRLESVRVLSISSCSFKAFKLSEFGNVVSRCPRVSTFSFICCHDDKNKLSESDMIPMREWKELQHLTLYSLIFKNCSFLKKVAESCKNLSSLSIITVHPNSVCLFMNDIIYVLRQAKNLSFIRINVKSVNPMYEGFWNAIGEAKNLEGICLITESSTSITSRTVLNGIKKLKYLHLFHFFASKAPERLFTAVKKSMQDHGIKNVKIEKECNTSNRDYECRRPYYHQQPRFCCNYLHLNEINIF